MNSRALQHIASAIPPASTGFSPYTFQGRQATYNNISNFIAPVQFERLATDIRAWREAIKEMELAFYPKRVRAQRIYMDTVENPYVKAVIERYKELTIQRDYSIYQIKGGKRVQSDVLTEALNEQNWFNDYVEYVLDAKFYGYSLIELRECINDGFPNITFTRRENIIPDDGRGTNSGPILTSLVYAVDGVHVKDHPLISLCNHWIPTKSNRGVSSIGYGLLYNIALCEIHLRHLLEWNMDYQEMYGMPIKKARTSKTGKDRDEFENFLRNASSNAYILLDGNASDEDIEYIMAQSAGTAWKSYENVENRLQGIISQLVLGHTDAIKSVPGKLGGMQAANKDGFNESLIEQAMNAKQTNAGNFVCDSINSEFAPKMRALGKYVGSKILKDLIPEGYKFGLLNDKEEGEVRRRINSYNLVESEIARNLAAANLGVDAEQFGKRMGLNLKDVIPTKQLLETRTTVDGDIPDAKIPNQKGSIERSLD